jgi:hypothetical protein
MTFDPASLSHRPGVRPWMILAPLAVVAAAGLVVLLMRGPAGQALSGGMRVEVVAPAEPEVQPGSTMEVGQLVDGYSHVELPTAAEPADAYDADYQTAWVEPLPPLREPSPTVWRSDAVDEPTYRPGAEVTRSGGRYGFDEPGPDYAAERRARQERLDRIQADQAARGRAGTPVAGPDLDRESAFY